MPLTQTRRRTRRFGSFVILCALTFRFFQSGGSKMLKQWLNQPNTLAILTYLETGRYVRFSAPQGGSAPVFEVFSRESPAPAAPEEDKPVFLESDADGISLTYSCSLRPELKPLLTRPLAWDLKGEDPSVLILHTHATESYTRQEEPYQESAAYRTTDPGYNMVSLGAYLKTLLAEGGITALHDETFHDYPSYNGSYVHARVAIEQYLTRYPSIRLVLDLHRDALETGGGQLRTQATAAGQSCAQLMLVMGTNASGQDHDRWEDNLSLALKLHLLLERQTPGITRPLQLRAQRFNQDLSPGAMIVEIGAAGNTRPEALRATEQLANAILSLAGGTG